MPFRKVRVLFRVFEKAGKKGRWRRVRRRLPQRQRALRERPGGCAARARGPGGAGPRARRGLGAAAAGAARLNGTWLALRTLRPLGSYL